MGRFICTAVIAAGLVAAPSAAAKPATLVGLGDDAALNRLFLIPIDAPTQATSKPVIGLAPGDNLRGIDYRPADGELYGVAINGDTTTTYRIDPDRGLATKVGSAVVENTGSAGSYGMDFNPVSDRLRVVNNLPSDGAGGNSNNFRLRPDDGSLAGVDTDLDFTGSGGAPAVGLAHDQNTPGAAQTTTYAVLSGGDGLARIGGINGAPSPLLGAVQNVGPLGVDTSNQAELDISEKGEAYAMLTAGGAPRLYRANLTTGAVTPTAADNRIGDGLSPLTSVKAPSLPVVGLFGTTFTIDEGGLAGVVVDRTGPLSLPSTVPFTITPAGATEADIATGSGTITFAPGQRQVVIAVPTVEDTQDELAESVAITLGEPTDAGLTIATGGSIIILDDDPPAGGGGAADTTAPRTRITRVPSRLSYEAFVKGVKPRLDPDEAAGYTLTLQRTVEGKARTLATKKLARSAKTRTTTVRPSRKKLGRPRAAFRVRLRVTGTDAAGNKRTTTKTIRVKAPRRRR